MSTAAGLTTTAGSGFTFTTGDRCRTTRFIPSGPTSVSTGPSGRTLARRSGEETFDRDGSADRDRRDTRSELGFSLVPSAFLTIFFSATFFAGAFFSATFPDVLRFVATVDPGAFRSGASFTTLFFSGAFFSGAFFSGVVVAAVVSVVFSATFLFGLREMIFFRVFSGDALLDFFFTAELLRLEVLRLGERLVLLIQFPPQSVFEKVNLWW